MISTDFISMNNLLYFYDIHHQKQQGANKFKKHFIQWMERNELLEAE